MLSKSTSTQFSLIKPFSQRQKSRLRIVISCPAGAIPILSALLGLFVGRLPFGLGEPKDEEA